MEITVEGLRARITNHAIKRYKDRVHQSGTRIEAGAQLVAVATSVGTWSDAAPAWVRSEEAARADRWLMLGEDVALPCCGCSLTTVLVRGGRTRAEQRVATRERRLKQQQRRQRRERQQRRGRLVSA